MKFHSFIQFQLNLKWVENIVFFFFMFRWMVEWFRIHNRLCMSICKVLFTFFLFSYLFLFYLLIGVIFLQFVCDRIIVRFHLILFSEHRTISMSRCWLFVSILNWLQHIFRKAANENSSLQTKKSEERKKTLKKIIVNNINDINTIVIPFLLWMLLYIL